jgi:hypothetical protein
MRSRKRRFGDSQVKTRSPRTPLCSRPHNYNYFHVFAAPWPQPLQEKRENCDWKKWRFVCVRLRSVPGPWGTTSSSQSNPQPVLSVVYLRSSDVDMIR